MDGGLESKIDVITGKLNSGFKEKLPRDIAIHGLEKEHQSFNSGGSILKIAPSTALHIQPALKNTHCTNYNDASKPNSFLLFIPFIY